MIWNWLGSGYKLSIGNNTNAYNDQSLKQRQYYRLDLYLHTSKFISNFAIIGIINIVLFILIVGLAIWKYRKDKR